MSLRTTCPYCHQTKTDETIIPPLPPQSSADALAYIQAETQRIADLITKLREDRSVLLRRLNAIQPATRVLFPEMLSLIFQYACPTPDHFQQQTVQKRQEFEDEDGYIQFYPGYQEDPPFHPPFHLILASVSSQWREIVHSTPNLWSSIQIQGARKRDAEKWALFLKNSFERSRNLPLDIVLVLSDSSWAENGHIFSTEFDDALQRNSRRIRSMFVRGYISRECFSMAETLPNVVDLVFEDLFMIIPGSIPELSFPLNPPLRRLHLDILNMNTNFDGVVASLTALNLFRTPIDVCMKLLISCPELVEFRCCSPLTPKRVHASSALSSQVSLSKLELLEWRLERDDYAKPWSRDLLTYINTPALRTLRWVQGSDISPQRYADLIPGFFARLPLTLETLEFVDVGFPVESLPTNHIRNDTHIKSIVLEGCHECLLLALLRKLQRSSGRPVPFRSLESIHCGGLILNVPSQAIGPCLVTMLEQRSDQVDRFSFSFSDPVPNAILYFDTATMERLRKLVKDGLDLTITSDGIDIFDEDEAYGWREGHWLKVTRKASLG